MKDLINCTIFFLFVTMDRFPGRLEKDGWGWGGLEAELKGASLAARFLTGRSAWGVGDSFCKGSSLSLPIY